MTQNTVSKIESASDMLISAIVRYMHSIGGGVELVLKMLDGKTKRVDFDPEIYVKHSQDLLQANARPLQQRASALAIAHSDMDEDGRGQQDARHERCDRQQAAVGDLGLRLQAGVLVQHQRHFGLLPLRQQGAPTAAGSWLLAPIVDVPLKANAAVMRDRNDVPAHAFFSRSASTFSRLLPTLLIASFTASWETPSLRAS
jgi:hypothetical protein